MPRQVYQALGREDSSLSSTIWSLLKPISLLIIGVALGYAISPRSSCNAIIEDAVVSKGTPVPEMPWKTVTFLENATFQERPSEQSQLAWNSLMPPGRGFVHVDDPAAFLLPPGQETESGPIYSVALFHQLHCLGQIHRAYWAFVRGIEKQDMLSLSNMVADHKASHFHHCIDYLRQSVMCAGDMALEWPRAEGPGKGIAVDGWGVPHRCRSWDAIMDYMADAHYQGTAYGNIAG